MCTRAPKFDLLLGFSTLKILCLSLINKGHLVVLGLVILLGLGARAAGAASAPPLKPDWRSAEDLYPHREDLVDLANRPHRSIIAVLDAGFKYNDPSIAYRLVQRLDDERRQFLVAYRADLVSLRDEATLEYGNSSIWYKNKVGRHLKWIGLDNLDESIIGERFIQRIAFIKRKIKIIDDVLAPGARGWDTVDNDDKPFADNNFGLHGSAVAFSATDGHNTAVLPIRVLRPGGTHVDPIRLTDAVFYAWCYGARVINLSFVKRGAKFRLDELISAEDVVKAFGDLRENGESDRELWSLMDNYPELLFVQASGNTGEEASRSVFGLAPTPALRNASNLVSVGTVNREDYRRASFSVYSSSLVEVASPFGDGSQSWVPHGGEPYILRGTSFSAPAVSQIFAELFYAHPELRVAQAIELFRDNVVTRTEFLKYYFRWGGYVDEAKVKAFLNLDYKKSLDPRWPQMEKTNKDSKGQCQHTLGSSL